MADLTDQKSHFAFGENWRAFSTMLDETRIRTAEQSVSDLAGAFRGKSFLDIGSGSGLFSLAAHRLGAERILAVDVDPDSVETTRRVLGDAGEVAHVSVFDLPAFTEERFDIVYSWGVLHHTGDMWRAIDCASQMVGTGGRFIVALYEKTPLDGFWKAEKRFYTAMPRLIQKTILGGYVVAHMAGRAVTLKNPFVHLRRNTRTRGMDIFHDMHDWLGGYPYETTTRAELEPFMAARGFRLTRDKSVAVTKKGLMGTACSEFVFDR